MSEIASTLAVGVILAFHGWFLVKDDDTQIIRTYMEHQWQRNLSHGPQPLLAWAQWCKAGFQLGEWSICPPR